MISLHTRQSLAVDLARLGVAPGDTLFVHSSFKSLGSVEGGALTVVNALEDAVGAEGLLLMPSFNLIPKGNVARAAAWNHAQTSSSVGWLTEFFRQMPGTLRSDHFSHSVAARGCDAVSFVEGHRDQTGMISQWDHLPWGRAFGDHSPFLKAYMRPCSKILMLGTDYKSTTFCHVVEVMFHNKRLQTNSKAGFQMVSREMLGAWWDENGRLSRGNVGDALSRLFGIKDFVDTLLAEVEKEPSRWCKWWQPDPLPGAAG